MVSAIGVRMPNMMARRRLNPIVMKVLSYPGPIIAKDCTVCAPSQLAASRLPERERAGRYLLSETRPAIELICGDEKTPLDYLGQNTLTLVNSPRMGSRQS